MESLLAISLIVVFAALASVHLYWAVGGRRSWDGTLAFEPSRFATLTIAGVMASCAVVIAAMAGFVPVPLPEHTIRSLAFGLAFVVAMRGVGDFAQFGIFKTEHGTYFAEMDSLVYSPLCLVLAIGALVLSMPHP